MKRTDLDIGPQYDRDPPFRKRMRFHQSWWRARELRVGYGVGPEPTSTRALGSMLRPADGDRGLNFLTPRIFEIVKARIGRNVDRYRCLNNMLSSQPMCFNLFGPLADDPDLATRLMRALFPDEVAAVTDVRIEWAPEPAQEYLGDGTSFDAFVEYVATDGARAFLGIETKLSESFGEDEYDRPRYRALTEHAGSPWKPEAWPKLSAAHWNQLWRNHLLVEAMLRHPETEYVRGRFVLVTHPEDRDWTDVARDYGDLLVDPEASYAHLPLDRIASRWRDALETPEERAWLDAFERRYVDLLGSEEEWTGARP